MKINPISYSVFNIRKNKERAGIFSSAEPVISDVPNFYIPTIINFRGQKDFRKELEEKFENSGKDDLALFLYESLNKRAIEKKISPRVASDTVQDGILGILLLLDDYEKNNKEKDLLLTELLFNILCILF